MKIYMFETRPDEMDAVEEMRRRHPDTEIVASAKGLTLDKISQLDQGSGVSVLGMLRYDEKEMQAFADRNIHYLSTRTIGFNHIDLDAAKAHGVHVCHAVYAPNGVADYTVMMILLCLRGYKQALWRMQVNDFSLDGLMGREIKDLTIGIVGTGRIGTQVAKNLSGFGCKIIGYDPYENETFKTLGTYVSLEELYRTSDVITVHVSLNKDNYHMIGDKEIQMMKKGVVLINCARGALMDIQALIRNIENEHIGALGLDTIEEEEAIVHRDLKTDILSNRDMAYIKQFKNVVYTQHMAFYTDAAVRSMVVCGIEGILAMAAGEKYPNQLC